jgi:hypothetical protein
MLTGMLSYIQSQYCDGVYILSMLIFPILLSSPRDIGSNFCGSGDRGWANFMQGALFLQVCSLDFNFSVATQFPTRCAISTSVSVVIHQVFPFDLSPSRDFVQRAVPGRLPPTSPSKFTQLVPDVIQACLGLFDGAEEDNIASFDAPARTLQKITRRL